MNLSDNVKHSRITPVVSLQKFLKDFIEAIETADISSFVNDANYITNSVNNLVNYYLKSEIYTKAEVAALIGVIQQFHYEVYASTSDVTALVSLGEAKQDIIEDLSTIRSNAATGSISIQNIRNLMAACNEVFRIGFIGYHIEMSEEPDEHGNYTFEVVMNEN